MWMRGGTSKGGYFLKDDLPADVCRARCLPAGMMGSPDPARSTAWAAPIR
jgi:4-oxalomesaconate tautomerase